ncbi:MAG TPA: hypothetical protein V6C72_05420, partial [Chroococcales cyanobacterium]
MSRSLVLGLSACVLCSGFCIRPGIPVSDLLGNSFGIQGAIAAPTSNHVHIGGHNTTTVKQTKNAINAIHDQSMAFRLPEGSAPTQYRLNFEPDLVKNTFQGKEEIDITVSKPLTQLTLNAAEIQFGAATLSRKGKGAGSMGTATVRPEPSTERVHFIWG